MVQDTLSLRMKIRWERRTLTRESVNHSAKLMVFLISSEVRFPCPLEKMYGGIYSPPVAKFEIVEGNVSNVRSVKKASKVCTRNRCNVVREDREISGCCSTLLNTVSETFPDIDNICKFSNSGKGMGLYSCLSFEGR